MQEAFTPVNRTPPCITRQIRIYPEDWERVETIAKKLGETPAEIARQAIRFALEHMK